ncbi:MAG: hypothetical protein ACM3PU_05645 [Gemmatimonadota bacterium]
MKRFLTQIGATTALLASATLIPTVALAQNRCDHPSGMIDKRACAKAAEGPDALRSFVSRTRMIWSLYYWDYAPRDEPTAATKTAPEAAPQAAGGPEKVAASNRPQ